MFSPLSMIRVRLLGLMGLALSGTGAYLLWERHNGGREREYLYWGSGVLAVSLPGRFLARPFLGLSGFSGSTLLRDGTGQRLKRNNVARCYGQSSSETAKVARAT